MKNSILFLLMFMILIPFVSAGIFDSVKSFAVGNWDNRIMGVIGAVIFFVLIIFFGRRSAGGSYGRGYGSGGAVSRLRTLRKARNEEVLEKNQLGTDRRIDNHIYKLRKIEDEINREEISLDRQLYTLEEYEQRLMYWEKRIGPYLLKLNDEIERIVRYIQKGKFKDPTAAKQNLEKLYAQFVMVSQKHYNLLERFRLVAEREEQIIQAKKTDAIREEEVVMEGRRDEKSELKNIKEELGEAKDELERSEEAGVSPKGIETQKKKISDIKVRKKTVRKELRGKRKERVIAKREVGLSESITKELDEQEKAINQLERIEITLAQDLNAGLKAIHGNRFKKQMKIVEANSIKVMGAIERLGKMDRKYSFLESRAKYLENKRTKCSNKQEEVMAKAA